MDEVGYIEAYVNEDSGGEEVEGEQDGHGGAQSAQESTQAV